MSDYGREIEIDGVRATRTYSFSGEQMLFCLRPNRWTSVIPYGVVSHRTITVGIEWRNEPERLKAELDNQTSMLRDYAGWQRSSVDEHNASLEQKISRLVATRREHLKSISQLKDLI